MIYTFHQLHQYHHLPLHLKFDTGLNRLGLTKDDLIDFDLSNKNIQSICSHIANQERYDSQKAQLKEIYQQYFQNQNIFIHLDSSAYLSLDDFTSAIRIGMGLYSSSQDVLTLIAYICRVKKIEKGDLVGYHLQESIKEDGYLLTISFGYADGWHIKRKTRAFIDNVFIHQVGETCMDYMMFYIPFYPQGKYVQLISKNNPLDQLEHLYNESRYTILASLNQRIKRKIK
jgi:alanine racemase